MTAVARTLVALALLATWPLSIQAQALRFEVPSIEGLSWFKGNTHTHTTESDGDASPEYVATWYRDHGYAFLVLSDHNTLTSTGALEHVAGEGFLLIPGEEVTSAFENRPVHVNGLNLPRLVEPRSGESLVATIQNNVDAVREATGVPHINHPNFEWAFGAEELAQVENDRLLEIFNGHPTVHNEGGGGSPGLEEIWDALLTGGKRIYGIAVDDAHHFQGEFSADRANPGRGWVSVLASELDADQIMASLEAGRFYASTGIEIERLEVTTDRLAVEVRPRGDERYTTEFIGDGGRVLRVGHGTSIEYRLADDVSYVRAVVRGSRGHRAWIQPVFVTRDAGVGARAGGPGGRPPPALLPAPASVSAGSGVFRLDEGTTTYVAHPEFGRVVAREVAALRAGTGLPLRDGTDGEPGLRVASDPAIPSEGYRLRTSPSGIELAASDEAGVFYAFQTLRQLLPVAIESGEAAPGVAWEIPAVTIEDAPRFPYRGLHLDVGRHFFDVEFVKRYIDTMARFKLNRFHWHLTEDQGWRIEIDAFPRLTEVGAWRAESPLGRQADPYVGDGERHGGFYTKDEIRDVVAYAADRFVTVIPEIEMPGHATAAIASYPEIGCTDERLDVSTRWGVHSTIVCPKEETFAFYETVLSEVMELFPSPVIHIGGDEVPKVAWQNSEQAQAVIRREGLADEDELQSWFIRRIERHLRASDRRLMGWDEILEGGLAPDAIVMSWRGMEGGIEAARQGHDVVMTPIQHAYFDFYQGDPETEPLAMNWAGFPITLETAYAFEPVPEQLTLPEAEHVLGGQGNLWTEYISTPEYAEYMAYPRALALAEAVWSPRERRDWADFLGRLRPALLRLDALGVNYRWPEELER